jgi:DNA ligase-1
MGETVSVMMADKWPNDKDPVGWWMSEKYDGVRGLWTGGKMMSRSGAEIPLPDTFRALLPKDLEVDGEFSIGRGVFNTTVTLLYPRKQDFNWEKMTYHVFDLPTFTAPFEDRVDRIKKMFGPAKDTPDKNGRIIPVEQTKITSRDQFNKFCEEIVNNNGEGVMLRKTGSPYVRGARSSFLAKWKPFLDMEVRMIAPYKKQGYRGLLCELPSGVQTFVKCTPYDYENPPPAGTVLTVKHSGEYESTGKLKHGILLRERKDMTWEDVLREFERSQQEKEA